MNTGAAGSSVLLCVGRGVAASHSTPTDNRGSTDAQLGNPRTYTAWSRLRMAELSGTRSGTRSSRAVPRRASLSRPPGLRRLLHRGGGRRRAIQQYRRSGQQVLRDRFGPRRGRPGAVRRGRAASRLRRHLSRHVERNPSSRCSCLDRCCPELNLIASTPGRASNLGRIAASHDLSIDTGSLPSISGRGTAAAIASLDHLCWRSSLHGACYEGRRNPGARAGFDPRP